MKKDIRRTHKLREESQFTECWKQQSDSLKVSRFWTRVDCATCLKKEPKRMKS